MFSIIIPLYNKSAYVAKAIQSVAAQTFQEFELIVIDDGSTDESLEQLRVTSYELQEKNSDLFAKIKIIEQVNQGVSNTRNNGVKLAKFPYITFLDADDWWEPTFLAEMKALIEEFPDSGIYGSSYYKVKNGSFIQANIGVETGFEKGYINYFKTYAQTLWMPLWTGAVVIPKSIFNEFSGFKPELKMGEDFHLWVRIANKYNVAFLNKPLSNYNQDVDIANRAVDEKLYNASEHMLFTDYNFLIQNKEFQFLFEKMAVYSLLPYFMSKKNINEVEKILSSIHWENHELKYRLYYQILPRFVVKWWYRALKFGSKIKKRLNYE